MNIGEINSILATRRPRTIITDTTTATVRHGKAHNRLVASFSDSCFFDSGLAWVELIYV
jgi:hypothetical protein